MTTAPVSWRGITVPYDRSERQIMSALTVREQAYIHRLKSLTGGELSSSALTDGEIHEPTVIHSDGEQETVYTDVSFVAQSRPEGGVTTAHPQSGRVVPGESTEEGVRPSESLYIDPEDIPFGETFGESVPKTVRKRPIYALCWTWKSSRIYKTKAKADLKKRVWKKWYERNGWKVTSHSTGYFASKDGVRHSVSLHEYDRETHERIK